MHVRVFPLHSSHARRRSARAAIALAVAAAVALGGLAAVPLTAAAVTPTAAAASGDVVGVDFSQPTGAVKGGATGMLYGLSDPGVPGASLIAGAHPQTVAQKAPDGEQHPNGDALKVADGFFASGGSQIVVYMQDVLSEWPYQNVGIDAYLGAVDTMVRKAVAERPKDISKFVWVPFNEPDGIWYQDWSTQKQKFFDDWKLVCEHIRAIDPGARIVGPNESGYNAGRLSDFLTWAKGATCAGDPQGNCLPDIMAWHELSSGSLADYRQHYAAYRALETQLGIAPLPINIDEYGDRSDMSVPGRMIQWISMFEDTKVDADMAYWTLAGNLSDHAVQTRKANGGWWLLKWYADLTGQTAKVTPPQLNVGGTVQATAAIDTGARRATVLVGGGANPLSLEVSGLDRRVFGGRVDVKVSKTTWTGYEGDAGTPVVVATQRARLTGGALKVQVPGVDVMAAYQVVITPAPVATRPVAADAPWTTSVEAESATLTAAKVYPQDTTANSWLYATSGQADVGSMNQVTSAVTFPVTVPRAGTYRLGIFYGTNAAPGRHALFVDGVLNQVVQYSATLGWTYRGRKDVALQLGAGTHQISVRTSADGVTLLPGSDVTLDKFDLTQVTGVERSSYTADDARLAGDALVARTAGTPAIVLGTGGQATYYVAAAQDGYQDLTIAYDAAPGSRIGLSVDGRAVDGLRARPGASQSRARVHLAAGITKVDVTGTGLRVLGLTVVRAAAADAQGIYAVEAENARLSGTAAVVTVPATSGSNASGGAYVGSIGNGAANTLTIVRPANFGPGEYDLDVSYANAAKNTGHAYNTDAISRQLDITEVGGTTTTGVYRHNYAWDNFWSQVTPVKLTTTGGALVLGNASDFGPNVDRVELAKFVLEVENTGRPNGGPIG